MARRLLLCLAFLLVLAAPAAGDDIHHKKRELDDRLSTLHSKIAHAKAQEGVLTRGDHGRQREDQRARRRRVAARRPS